MDTTQNMHLDHYLDHFLVVKVVINVALYLDCIYQSPQSENKLVHGLYGLSPSPIPAFFSHEAQ